MDLFGVNTKLTKKLYDYTIPNFAIEFIALTLIIELISFKKFFDLHQSR